MTNTTTSSGSMPTPAPFGPDDPRAVFARAVALAGDTIAAVGPEALTRPTPCADMDVRALLGHLVVVLRRVAAVARNEDTTAWAPVATDVADDAWLGAWRAAAHEVQQAWTDDATLDAPIVLPWTTMTGRQALATYTNEVTVHTWDLARATGQSPRWDESVVAVAYDAIRAELPEAERGPRWAAAKQFMPAGFPWVDPFADATPVADDAPLVDRLAAWNGRAV